jgi:site-specific recombinase XerD
MCRHIVASHLYANGVPVCQIAVLLGDKEKTVRNAYMFVDRSQMLRDVTEAQATIFRGLSV